MFFFIACGGNTQKEDISIEKETLVSQSEQDSIAVVGNFIKQAECWNHGDIACFVKGYYPSEKAQIISGSGIKQGYDNILRAYKGSFPEDKMGKLFFDNLELKRLSDINYYVTGRYNLEYEEPDTILQGWFSILMEKKDSTWYMLSDHTSSG